MIIQSYRWWRVCDEVWSHHWKILRVVNTISRGYTRPKDWLWWTRSTSGIRIDTQWEFWACAMRTESHDQALTTSRNKIYLERYLRPSRDLRSRYVPAPITWEYWVRTLVEMKDIENHETNRGVDLTFHEEGPFQESDSDRRDQGRWWVLILTGSFSGCCNLSNVRRDELDRK